MVSNFELFEYLNYFDYLAHRFNFYLNSKDKNHLDFSQGQGRIIGVLLLNDGISTKDLSARTGINLSSLNEMLSKLEKKDLIKRKPLESDKRIIVNCLTEKARKNRPRLDLSFFDCLTQDQKEDLFSLMVTLNRHLLEKIDSFDDENLINGCHKRKKAFEFFLEDYPQEVSDMQGGL